MYFIRARMFVFIPRVSTKKTKKRKEEVAMAGGGILWRQRAPKPKHAYV
jgi:hypothetical protein